VPTRMLDISRLISRVGNGPHTGIDRVELAYFNEFLNSDKSVFFLCRLPKSYAILDRAGGQKIFDRLVGAANWGRRGMARFLALTSNPAQQSAISEVWRSAVLKSSERQFKKCMQANFGSGVQYFNVGHSNLRRGVLSAISNNTSSEIVVFIHDVIPITSSDFSSTETNENFELSISLVAEYADKIIYNSTSTQRAAEAQFVRLGCVPPGISAHIGVEPKFGTTHIQAPNIKPNFVILGTIEPRKNHALLLSIWQGFEKTVEPSQIPILHIVGKRGWKNSGVFSKLDNDPLIGKTVFEHNNLSDLAMREMLAQSWGLLFPSHAEGFGLPLIEAAALGIPIICGENDIYREILGDYPLYLNVDNSYLWSKRILGRAGRNRESEADRHMRAGKVKIPTWNEHFDQIFRFV
jgi:glycosyltransferase involved in cell wall biosynthesis